MIDDHSVPRTVKSSNPFNSLLDSVFLVVQTRTVRPGGVRARGQVTSCCLQDLRFRPKAVRPSSHKEGRERGRGTKGPGPCRFKEKLDQQ